MQALVLDGARVGDVAVAPVRQVLVGELEARGWTVTTVALRECAVAGCIGKFCCWVEKPGECIIDDFGHELPKLAVQSDLVLGITPVTFGGYSSELKKAMDRLVPAISPFFNRMNGETHHRQRYAHYPRLLMVGLLPHVDAESEAIFHTLVSRNALNFHSPDHSSLVLRGHEPPAEWRQEFARVLAEVGVAA